MFKNYIKLYADYGSTGLWNREGMVPFESVNINEELKQKISRWINWYSENIDWSNPGAGSIFSEEEKERFLKLEKEIYQSLLKCLGNDYEVDYYSSF